MKKTFVFVGGVIIAGIICAFICGATRHAPDVRTISVTGECLTTAPQDRTAITLRVTTLDKSASVSMKQATDRASEITEYLKEKNVQVQTTQFNSYEKTKWDHTAQKSITLGIETTIALEVSSDSIDTIESILTQFAGAENVFPENLRMFTSAQTMQPILEKCLGAAVENARARANALAAGDGRRAGRIISLAYGSGAPTVMTRTSNFLGAAKFAMAEDAAIDAGGTIVSKDTQVSVSVSAVFEIR